NRSEQYAWQGRQAFLNFKVSLQPACKLCGRFGQHPIVGLEFNHLVGIEITLGLQSRVIVRRDFSSRSKEFSLQLLHSQRILVGGSKKLSLQLLHSQRILGGRSKELSLQLLHSHRILGGGSKAPSLQLLHSYRILRGGDQALPLRTHH